MKEDKKRIPPNLSIKDVEDLVGKKASDIRVRTRDIVLYFTGGITDTGGLAATVEWRIKGSFA